MNQGVDLGVTFEPRGFNTQSVSQASGNSGRPLCDDLEDLDDEKKTLFDLSQYVLFAVMCLIVVFCTECTLCVLTE